MSNYIPRTLAFANGKGGVGKTSMTSNCGALAAAGGWKVLLVDLDPQGDLSKDLGYPQDDGNALLSALLTEQPLPILTAVRERLDVVPSGAALGDIPAVIAGRAARHQEPGAARTFGDLLNKSLAPHASNYDLIIFDLPPGEPSIVSGTLECTRTLVIPTRADAASVKAIGKVATAFTHARETNPHLRLGGVALFQIGARSTRLHKTIQAKVTALIGTAAPVFDTHIRHLESAAFDMRDHGLLAHELESHAAQAQTARLRALRSGTVPATEFLSRRATGLAEDYEQLTMEIFHRMSQFDEEELEGTSPR